MTAWLAACAGLAALAGLGQAAAGLILVRRFTRRLATRPGAPVPAPPVTLLKPLHGDEPGLAAALASFCGQDYPELQVVFGIQHLDDPAAKHVERMQAAHPGRAITLVRDPTPHGQNRKISNLINMLPASRHAILVIADSDLHAAPGYLHSVVAALARPGVGLVTTLNIGRAGHPCVAGRLGAAHITDIFTPGALLARALGRQDCLGTTMALRRDVLAAAGGLDAIADELADDAVLGERVRALGLSVVLADTITAQTVPERTLAALFRHELRWGRTIRSVAPVPYALSLLQFPLVWAAVAIALSAAAPWTLLLFAACWAGRAALARANAAALGADPLPALLWPVREALSAGVVLVSFTGNRVEWRGAVLHASRPAARVSAADQTLAPARRVRSP